MPEAKQRLAESFETALRHADGRAVAVEMDTQQGTSVLGEIRLSDLQLFAAGTGAAPVLVQQSDGRVPASATAWATSIFSIPSASSLSRTLSSELRRDQGLGQAQPVLSSRCSRAWRKHYDFDIEQSFEKPAGQGPAGDPVWQRQGTRSRSQYISERGKPTLREHVFEGIVHNLERRYNETDSPTVREELAKYLNS